MLARVIEGGADAGDEIALLSRYCGAAVLPRRTGPGTVPGPGRYVRAERRP